MVKVIPCITISRGFVSCENGKMPIDKFIDEHYEKYEILVVVDHDAHLKGKPQIRAIQDLSEEFFIWLDANPKDVEEVIDLFVAGADHVILIDDNITVVKLKKICKMSTDLVLQINNLRMEYLQSEIKKIILPLSETYILHNTLTMIKNINQRNQIYIKMKMKPQEEIEGVEGIIVDLWQMRS